MEKSDEQYTCAACNKPIEEEECLYDQANNVVLHKGMPTSSTGSVEDLPCMNKFMLNERKSVLANLVNTSELPELMRK